MDKDIKEDWIEALRSGEYVQGQGYLERADGRQCVLGVLCDILDLDWSSLAWVGINARVYRYQDYAANGTGTLPPGLRAKLGISESDAIRLASMNDRGATFGELADWIEVYL